MGNEQKLRRRHAAPIQRSCWNCRKWISSDRANSDLQQGKARIVIGMEVESGAREFRGSEDCGLRNSDCGFGAGRGGREHQAPNPSTREAPSTSLGGQRTEDGGGRRQRAGNKAPNPNRQAPRKIRQPGATQVINHQKSQCSNHSTTPPLHHSTTPPLHHSTAVLPAFLLSLAIPFPGFLASRFNPSCPRRLTQTPYKWGGERDKDFAYRSPGIRL